MQMLLRKRASIVVCLSPPEPVYVSTAAHSARQACHGVYRMRRPPDGMGKFVGLKSKRCAPCEGGNVPKLSQAEAEALRIQVSRRPAVVQQTRIGSRLCRRQACSGSLPSVFCCIDRSTGG